MGRPAGRNFLTSKPCGKKFTTMTIKKMIDISRTDRSWTMYCTSLTLMVLLSDSAWLDSELKQLLRLYSNMDVNFLVNLYQVLTTYRLTNIILKHNNHVVITV